MAIKLKEKIGYGFGDFASSMFWKLFSMFLMIYYTDVFGLTPASVGLMFLLTRIWDSINDPLMGVISDRTNTKYGKFRPYLLWMAIPFSAIGILTFYAPNLGDTGKLVYAYITYTLMMMVYTGINVPYSSLLGVMSSDQNERNSLATFRFIGAFAGGIFVTSTAAYFIGKFKDIGANDAQGYLYTVTIYAILAAILFVVTFKLTKERVKPQNKGQSSLKQDLKDLSKNTSWFIMIGAGVATLIFNSLRDGSMMYYFKYYIKNQEVFSFGEIDWETLAAAYMTMWLVSNIVGVVLAAPVARFLGKKNTFITAMLIGGLISVMLYWVSPTQIILIYGLNILIGISAGMVLPLIWSMYADISDYSEWKNGRRATGLIFSSSSMSQKMGWTLGGAIAGGILAAYGFEANAEQSTESINGIRLMLSVYPGLGAFLSVVFMCFYKLDDKSMKIIEVELNAKRDSEIEESNSF